MKNKFTFTLLAAGILAIGYCLSAIPVHAQDSARPEGLIDKAGEKAALDAGKAFTAGATNVANWETAPYLTYFPNKVGATQYGGGLYVQYKIKGSENFSLGLGLDWLGKLTMPSGSVTAKVPIDIGKRLGLFAEGKFIVTPFALAGIATPLSGAGDNNGGVAAIAGAGAFIPIKRGATIFGHTTDISVGYAGVKWVNAGKYDGMHHELFANFTF